MSGSNYYLLTSLPPLGGPGSSPPLGLGDYLARVAHVPKILAEGEALFLGDDLHREALQAGEIDEPAPCVLTVGQLRGEEPLPPYLAGGEDDESAGRLSVDAAWSTYSRHVAELGRRSEFLAAWIRHEVGLRNALATARAKALNLEVERYLVAPELGLEADQFGALIGEWSAAPTPLAGLRALDAGRWAWLDEHDKWFSFADDELAAYAARLMLLHRWKRIDKAAHDAQPAPAGG